MVNKGINTQKPTIDIVYDMNLSVIAQSVAFGIEEEGVPFSIKKSDKDAKEESLLIMKKNILGITVAITKKGIEILYKNLKEKKPFLHYDELSVEKGRIAGKNAAKIVKKKPLVLERRQ